MELKVLQASYGDSFHLRFKDNEGVFRNIIIDSGPGEAYENKGARGIGAGDFKLTIEQIKSKNEAIDLLILTHVDDDHIGGILKWFEKETPQNDFLKKIWFNSGKLIFEYFNEKLIEDNLLKINKKSDLNTSIKQGVIFEEYIETNKMWDKRIIKQGDELSFHGLKFLILSPSEDNLRSLLCKWEKEAPIIDTAKPNDYKISLSEHLKNDIFKEDTSIHNESSIAFILEYNDKKILFLGDAHPRTIIKSLNKLGYSSQNKIDADFIKISHHGSKANTNKELLQLINSENFIISSNGSKHNLPDKKCLARIIGNRKNVNIFFNYPFLINKIFMKSDYEDFPEFKTLPITNIEI